MFFDSVCPIRPSYTVTKYKIYPTILLMERIYKWSWVLFCNFILWLAKPRSKMPCILLFETEYSLEFVYTNLPFLSRPSDTKIQTAITWCLQQQKSQKFENVRLWTSIFRYENLKIVSLITSELFNRNLSIVHPTLFFNSVIAPKLFWQTASNFDKQQVILTNKVSNLIHDLRPTRLRTKESCSIKVCCHKILKPG